ncbi:transporter substrate-binding domain-containing protein [Arenivirga flava]|uniref:Amino acid ABC transporter substrate-binding protein n=1 Tax=Arenivirga flava TaxID=1930060 RepID=A0AA37X9Y2_9MICO|nr:transporter substrate-binding domain-containing protein [Arenivirga flava]GMA26865.1 amino acid ABC transporter substrate-binding protein [Arenivirga flava]
MPRNRFRPVALLGAAVAVTALAACSTGEAAPGASEGSADVLTIATGQPAYPPYVIDDAPESGEGFESAVAYAVAEELGYDAEQVEWVRSTFDQGIAPGAKDWDLNLQQFTITEERAEAVDFSSSYYNANQAVVSIEGSPAADASSLADLRDVRLGAMTGTSSLTALNEVVDPSSDALVFNSNDDLVLALQNGQVDAIVVDLPTALFVSSVQVEGGVLIGQLDGTADESEGWGFVLEKDSPLTAEVTAAVDALRADGTLDALVQEWLTDGADAPILN